MTNYESEIAPARKRFASRVEHILICLPEPMYLARFLIQYCALGVWMTEHVPQWITRAGEACTSMGLTEIGTALKSHAKDEEGHHLLMIEDTKKLIRWYNDLYSPKLNPSNFLYPLTTPGVDQYWVLHEKTIASDHPYGQVAIEYEVERISVEYGPKMMEHCAKVLGPEVVKNLSFIQEHMVFDVGHTKYNAAMMGKLLIQHPQFLPNLVKCGSQALDAYAQYLEDCFEKT